MRLRLLFLLLALTAPAAAQTIPGVTVPRPAPTGTATASEADRLAVEAALDRLRDVLADDAARAALLRALESAAAPEEPLAGSAAVNPEGPPTALGTDPALDMVERVAARTDALARRAQERAQQVLREVRQIATLPARLAPSIAERRSEVGWLLVTIALTWAAHAVLGGLARRMIETMPPRPTHGGRLRQVGLAMVLRALAVIVAWALGLALSQGVAASAASSPGRLSLPQTYYLNAFLLFGLARVLSRTLANPAAATEPALTAKSPDVQRAIYRALLPVLAILVQGSLFVVPLAHLWGGFAATRPTRTLVATAAALAGLYAIRRIARVLDHAAATPGPPAPQAALATATAVPETGLIGPDLPGAPPVDPGAPDVVTVGAGAVWRALWPPLAVVYVAYAWFVAVTRPALVRELVGGGTALTLLALGAVLVGLSLLAQSGRLRAPLPALVRTQAAAFADRADRLTRQAMRVVAFGLLFAAPWMVAQGWGWIDLGALWQGPWLRPLVLRLLMAALIVGLAALAWALVASWIDARLTARAELGSARTRTLLVLFRNAFTVALVVVAGMLALSQVGLDIAPLLAGAGVVGLAIGFGSQRLVQDIITGIFIQLENALDVGDVVLVAGITGTVDRVTIRSVRLRSADGGSHVIPFSSVTTVTNLTRDYSYHVCEVTLSFEEDAGAMRGAMRAAWERVAAGPFGRDLDGEIEVQGVTDLRDGAMAMRARVRTRPGRQWAVGRAYNETLAEVCRERGIVLGGFETRNTVLAREGGRGDVLAAEREAEREAARDAATDPGAHPLEPGVVR